LAVSVGVKVVPTTTLSIAVIVRSHTVITMIVTMFVTTLYARVATKQVPIIVMIARNTIMMTTLATVVVTAVMVVAIV
jgi:hypothetical protein